MKEIWKDIPGYENFYQVSNLGRVRSKDRTLPNGKFFKSKLLRPRTVNKYGHQQVILGNGYPGQHQGFGVHRLVLLAFVGPRPDGMESRHFPDQNPRNNRLDNLSYATAVVNQSDRIIRGNTNRGEQSGKAKLTNELVLKIRKLHKEGVSCYKLAKMFGVDSGGISQIVRRITWRHI